MATKAPPKEKTPADLNDPLQPDGRKLTQAIRDLVATEGRPLRLDEFVAHTGATVEAIRAAFNLEEMGVPVSELLLDDGFDEPSGLDAALAAASGPVRVNSGDAEGRDGVAAPPREPMQPLPGMPESLAWGTHNGFRVTHGEGKPKGSFRLPDRLAQMVNDEEFVATVRFKFDYDGHRRNPKQEGRTSTMHKSVTLEIVAVDLVTGPLPPSNS